MSEPS